MERLTYKGVSGAVPTKTDFSFVFRISDKSYQGINEILNRLAEYEDTGLTPAEIAEYTKAKDEGRLVILPCKVGDTVYYIPQYGGKPCGGIRSGKAQMVGYTTRNIRIKISEYHPHNQDFALGKTLFLAREEAEEALRKKNE